MTAGLHGAVAAQQPPPPPPPLDLPPERDLIPGPAIIFFNDAGGMIAPDDVLRRAVEHWQREPYEGFLLCVRRKDGAGKWPWPNIAEVAKRLHAQGAKLVVADVARPCQGPVVNASQHQFDSVEVLGIHAL
jgi:hypothetical protein